MKGLSSIDVHFLAQELRALEGARIDKIYQKGKEDFLFQLHKGGEGKKLLRILVGKSMFLTSLKEDTESLSGFCMLLRKHLDNASLVSIFQVEPERIIKMTFEAKGQSIILYAEFFGKGNLILCKEKTIIIDALTHHEFKDRKVGPKETYRWPAMQYDVFSLEIDYLSSLLSSTKKESLVKCLAIDLGLGGMYGEEICLRASLDKNAQPAELSDKEITTLLGALKHLTSGNPSPIVYLSGEKVTDVYPFPLKTFEGKDSKRFATLSEALEHYCENFSPEKKSSYDGRVDELRRIIDSQEKNIVELQREEQENREKAEAIYSNYMQIKTVLDELREISKKHSWQQIKERLKDHALIKEVNPKEKSVVMEFTP